MLCRSSSRRFKCSSTSVSPGASSSAAVAWLEGGPPSASSTPSDCAGAAGDALLSFGAAGSGCRVQASSDHWPVKRSITSRGCVRGPNKIRQLPAHGEAYEL